MHVSSIVALMAFRTMTSHAPDTHRVADPCPAASSQAALTACADSAYRRADAQLNETYARTRARLPAAERAKLLDAERAWLRFRDAHCAFVAAAYEGGSMQPMQRLLCLEAVTRAREAQLHEPSSPNGEGAVSMRSGDARRSTRARDAPLSASITIAAERGQ